MLTIACPPTVYAGNGNILVWKRKAEEYLISQAAGGDLTCARLLCC